MQVRSLGFTTDLFVRRAEGATIVDAGGHIVVRTPDNPTFRWGNFVLVSGPEELERGLEIFQGEFPEATHVAIGIDGRDGTVPASAGPLGLEPDVSVILVARSLASPVPVDAGVRPLSSEADWNGLLQLRSYEAEPSDDDAFERTRVLEAKRTTDAGLGQFLGAFRGGELVAALGIVSDGAATARYQNVMTHPDHRRQGLAGHLVAAAAAEANRRWSADRLVIAADPDGPAVGLYRRLGFQDTEFEVQLARS